MRKPLLLIIIAVLVVSDLLALDDITTGIEPDFYLEYGFLAVSFVIIGIIVVKLRRGSKP